MYLSIIFLIVMSWNICGSILDFGTFLDYKIDWPFDFGILNSSIPSDPY